MKKVFVTLSILALSHSAFALEQLNDQDLASQTGQDGITIKLGVSAVTFDQLSLIDTDGIAATTSTGSAALAIAPITSTGSVKVNFLNAGGTSVNNLFTATIDSDGGATPSGAFANINLAFSELKQVTIDPFAIYLAPTVNASRTIGSTGSVFTGTALRSGVSKLLQIGDASNKLSVNFKDALGANIQLGGAPQGHLVQLSGSLQSINIPKIKIFSKNTVASEDNSLSLDAAITATNSATGIRLDGFYMDVAPDGLNFGKTGTTDKFDLTLNNVVVGKLGATDAGSFNGLKNGSMGSFGLIGASVTNLKVNVKGM